MLTLKLYVALTQSGRGDMSYTKKALAKINELVKRDDFVAVCYIWPTSTEIAFTEGSCIVTCDGDIVWEASDVGIRDKNNQKNKVL